MQSNLRDPLVDHLIGPGKAFELEKTAAAKLKSTRRISCADGFAAALAQSEGAALVTGDPELAAMTDVVTVEWIGT